MMMIVSLAQGRRMHKQLPEYAVEIPQEVTVAAEQMDVLAAAFEDAFLSQVQQADPSFKDDLEALSFGNSEEEPEAFEERLNAASPEFKEQLEAVFEGLLADPTFSDQVKSLEQAEEAEETEVESSSFLEVSSDEEPIGAAFNFAGVKPHSQEALSRRKALLGAAAGAIALAGRSREAEADDTEDAIARIAAQSNQAAKADREAPKEEKVRDSSEGKAQVGGILLGGTALSVPFFAENLKRLGTKIASGGKDDGYETSNTPKKRR